MAAVPAILGPYVTSLEAYDVELGAPGVHRGLPTTSLTFVLPMGEPLDVGWEGDVQAPHLLRCLWNRSTSTQPRS